MSRPFQRSNPNLNNADYIRNKKSKVMYNHMVNIAANNKCSSSDGKTKLDCGGFLLHTNNQETLRSLKYGYALCAPCDISGLVTEPLTVPSDTTGILDKCKCRFLMTDQMRITLYHILGDHKGSATASTVVEILEYYGIGPDYIYLPWNPFEKPGSHNAYKTFWAPECDKALESDGLCPPGSEETLFWLQDISSEKFASCPFDISAVGINHNILPVLDASGDCSGAICGPTLVSIYGAYLNIADSSINVCDGKGGVTYMPKGTFAFDMITLLSSWLYLWESVWIANGKPASSLPWPAPCASVPPTLKCLGQLITQFHKAGIYGTRPPTTIDNYLNNFAQNTPLRFYRSKY